MASKPAAKKRLARAGEQFTRQAAKAAPEPVLKERRASNGVQSFTVRFSAHDLDRLRKHALEKNTTLQAYIEFGLNLALAKDGRPLLQGRPNKRS